MHFSTSSGQYNKVISKCKTKTQFFLKLTYSGRAGKPEWHSGVTAHATAVCCVFRFSFILMWVSPLQSSSLQLEVSSRSTGHYGRLARLIWPAACCSIWSHWSPGFPWDRAAKYSIWDAQKYSLMLGRFSSPASQWAYTFLTAILVFTFQMNLEKVLWTLLKNEVLNYVT